MQPPTATVTVAPFPAVSLFPPSTPDISCALIHGEELTGAKWTFGPKITGSAYALLCYHIFGKSRLHEVWLKKCYGPIYWLSNLLVLVKGVISLLVILGLIARYIAAIMRFWLSGLAEIAMFSSTNLP
ncbi:hypothetical protein SLEP1_g18626 [Rubroshorea leprosula]|uniref:Uncharacterized protein n=1 Tax=Rubroshorea leprosula TaxID=152421 RepID=A0AAV5IY65_9ROSI|nr:hypothetical protein SLEP1_g18626 [Rubroshorea leprosula]